MLIHKVCKKSVRDATGYRMMELSSEVSRLLKEIGESEIKPQDSAEHFTLQRC